MFAPGSRYAQVPEADYLDAHGRARPYKLLRILRSPAAARQVHELADGERLDLVANRFFGDPQQFWRICDANRRPRPEDLEVAGTPLTIPIVTG
jgi:hypothetical protein